jgi:hypothetical protein
LHGPDYPRGPMRDRPAGSQRRASASKIERRSSRIRGHCRVCLAAVLDPSIELSRWPG